MGERVDAAGAAYAGSQLQTQLYVNKRRRRLDDELCGEFPELAGAELDWRSPLADDDYAEYYGSAFLDRVGLGHHAAALKRFWPSRGPQWDALAVVRRDGSDRPGVLLVEGKSHVGEMLSGSSCAAAPGSVSRTLIESSLGWAQERLGVQGKSPADWCGPLYQNANRLAMLLWLHSLGVRAWFAHLLFVGDDTTGPAGADDWAAAVKTANDELGLTGVTVPGAGHVLLPAGTRAELLAA